MYTLQRDNVVRLTDSEVKRDKYLSEGFELVEEPAEQPAGNPEENPEGQPENKPEEIPEVKEKPAKKGKSDD